MAFAEVYIGHNFMKVTFSLQRKPALEEGSIGHYEFNNGAAILVASITHLLCRQDSTFLRPKNHHTATVSLLPLANRKSR